MRRSVARCVEAVTLQATLPLLRRRCTPCDARVHARSVPSLGGTAQRWTLAGDAVWEGCSATASLAYETSERSTIAILVCTMPEVRRG